MMNYPRSDELDQGLFEVVQCPSDSAALSNYAYIAPGLIDPKVHYVIVAREFVFSVRVDRSIQKNQIGINGTHRRWASFSIGQRVTVDPFDIHSEGMDIYLGSLKMDLDFFQRSNRLPDEFKEEDLAQAFSVNFHSQMFTKGQFFVFEYHGVKFRATVRELDVVDLNVLKRGEVDALLSKFVGQSEENVRKLFADAEEEYRSKGEESGLHIIIFDELDAICKSRGSRSDNTGVGDSVVNQLLAKMDGVEQLNNILIIGMTNRKDMIDEALLRPGRLEVHMEIGLPDEKGRHQILKIHTGKMRTNDVLDDDVNLDDLAELTKNYSGAEISGVVKAASSYAFSRHIKVGTMAGISADVENMKVCMDDFLNALKEVQPAFGVSEAELQQCVQNHIIPFSPSIDQILEDGRLYVDQVRQSSRTPLVSVLLTGAAGSGKTALAATIAMKSDFPFIKLISPESMVGMSESAKVNEINKIFNDSYKSPVSVIVIDAIERLLDYVPIGPRFSNSVLQALMVLLKKKPPKDRRLLILATTTQRQILDQMDMTSEFSAEIYVPTITSLESVDIVLQQLELFEDAERERALSLLSQANMDHKLTIGVKKLLMIIEMARQDENKVDKFVNAILAL
ncbi:Vesicular-fusion protein sec18 [Choanephora cucurbitarum]|uniref:Vesicular-fusion protein SEC18 n=1 Tax=Choanephora cucurbitarum TaxID=101091 RepID=A0A1C7NEW6_9FUNG|nr:Vesicular-fusion protein sec18 [Choanephora cucurbitarum]